MDEEMDVGLEQEIFADLSVELSVADPKFKVALLLSKIRCAIREVKKARKYPSYYTNSQIEADMYEYYSNIRNIALYDYNQIGAEGQDSISENGISRKYVDRNRLFSGVVPLSRL